MSSVDLYPTILEMAREKPLAGQILDGESLAPLLRGSGRPKRTAIFGHFPHYVLNGTETPSTWVRSGDWKLIRRYGEGPGQTNGFELYHLKNDPGEKTNLTAQHPNVVAQLDALITSYLQRTQALVPRKNPDYDGSKPATTTKKAQSCID